MVSRGEDTPRSSDERSWSAKQNIEQHPQVLEAGLELDGQDSHTRPM
jgi:hypothetical protein